jgi:hypothetical protein
MIESMKPILTGQFEAALCMLNQCVAACPPAHWEGKIANDTFRQIAYHTLFYADFYMTRDENAFELRDLNRRGGDERGPDLSPGLSKDETLEYAAICRRKAVETLAAETAATLAGASGFARHAFSRVELHIYNLRHIQHHTGAMSAYLRRIEGALPDWRALPWVGRGWK